MKTISTLLISLIASSAFAATIDCKPSAGGLFYSVRFETTAQNKIINVTSSTGGYSSLDLTECKTSTNNKITTCTRSYLRNEDRKRVTHTVRINLGSPLRASYVERDLIIPGQIEIKGEILNYCEVI